MAKVYESKAAYHTIALTKKDGKNPVLLKFDAPTKFMFGTLTLNEALLRQTGYLDLPTTATDGEKAKALKDAEAIVAKVIESLPDFSNRIVGVDGVFKGIWPREERAALIVAGGVNKIKEGLNAYSDDQLKGQLKRLKADIPVNPNHETLVNAVHAAMLGDDVVAANTDNPNAQNSTTGGITQGAATRQA